MNRRVVITGIGAVSPNGIGREAFWEATRNGRSGVRRITRFDASRYAVQVAGEVTGFREEDYVSPKDRPHVSRAAPLAVAAVQEALADSGLEPARMSRDQLRQIGVILGSGGGSQEFTEEQYRLYYAGKERQCSVYVVPTGTIGTLAGEVSMRFGFRGLSHVLSTGCTSSTDAIGYAYRNIRSGVIDVMVSGGVDAPIAPLILRGFMLMRIMSTRWNAEPQRASRPFSRDRDGFVVAEGSWFFVLEELERARARGAKVYGEIAGYGSTCEAFHRVRLEECGEEPARAMRLAIADGGIPPEAVQYIHYHGTSTELNDRIETKATHLAFDGHAAKLAGSSLKSLIGHPQGACGAAGIAATLLAMRDGVLPPTINLDVPDPQCDLDYVTDVGRRMDLEYALSNCIAFGSKNSAILLRKIA
jgi:3-oxoacyl-[acyl-carrier-protein] synthase II